MSKSDRSQNHKISPDQPSINDLRELAAEHSETEAESEPPVIESQFSDTANIAQTERVLSETFFSTLRQHVGGRYRLTSSLVSGDSTVALVADRFVGRDSFDADDVDLIQLRPEHYSIQAIAFTGANCLVYDPQFDYEGRISRDTQTRYALPVPFGIFDQFDISERDITILDSGRQYEFVFHDGSNYYYRGGGLRDGWVGRLDMAVETVKEAKDRALKPESVIEAEQDGRDVTRQGDWFFVETDDEPEAIIRHPDVEDGAVNDRQLGNHLAEWQGVTLEDPQRVFVRGQVEHRTDDHNVEVFSGWREAINNGVEAYSFESNLFSPSQLTETNLVEDHLRGRQIRSGSTQSSRSRITRD